VAVRAIRKRLRVLQERGARYDEIVTRSNLAWGLRLLGRNTEALHELDVALGLVREIGTFNVLLEFPALRPIGGPSMRWATRPAPARATDGTCGSSRCRTAARRRTGGSRQPPASVRSSRSSSSAPTASSRAT
jgi:hypothetical protein